MTPDTFYAVELLDATGICVVSTDGQTDRQTERQRMFSVCESFPAQQVPGSGFRQKQGLPVS